MFSFSMNLFNTPCINCFLCYCVEMEERNAERVRLKSEREEKRRKAEDTRLVGDVSTFI